MSELETAGYRRYWPMKMHEGRETLPDGRRVQYETHVYRDMVSGQIHRDVTSDGEDRGWNGHPPDLAPGSKEREGSERVDRDAYRRGYDLINWGAA